MEILQLLRKLARKGFDIFCWVPRHVGAHHKELADTSARSMSDHMQQPVCYQDLKVSVMRYIHRICQETWDQQATNTSYIVFILKLHNGQWYRYEDLVFI
ncbi:hypothetical protein TNCT_387161 [Trichonephila clavata]|uniref:RNase H type-1 domain-containing protein n=1 Tax=Trichonephila clavata TaxID=2740835 RepID=A0A8X6FG66_TRICU|nr:hypothetical protein TNCT_387161 [Trichonephila clavata]